MENIDIKECWAQNNCKGYPKRCNKFCDGYVILEILYSQSNIPLRYQYPQDLKRDPVDGATFDYIVKKILPNVKEWVESGNNLLMYGDRKGNGKTSFATVIANAYIREMVHTTDFRPVVYFIKTAKFLEELRSQFDEKTDDFATKLKTIETVPLLIMDDIGAEKPSDWVRERLLNIIDERYSNKLSTIYTSNFNLKELEINLHSRISDRVSDSTKLEFRGLSKRGVTNE